MSLSETLHAGGFMLAGNFDGSSISVDQGTMKSGQAAINAGTVLGLVQGAGTTSETHAGNTGNGAMGAITTSDGAKEGVYTLTITAAATNAGSFQVADPNGDVIGNGTVGVAFAAGGLSFTLADGSIDFVVGDKFKITVDLAAGKYVQLAPTATDGSEVAAGILWDYTDASSADAACAVVTRLAEVTAGELTWPAGITAAQQAAATAQLAARNIILR